MTKDELREFLRAELRRGGRVGVSEAVLPDAEGAAAREVADELGVSCARVVSPDWPSAMVYFAASTPNETSV